MSPYKLSHTETDAIQLTFDKFDSPLSEKVFTINNVNISDKTDEEGGGYVEFDYSYRNEAGQDVSVSDPEIEKAMEEVFREILAGMVASMGQVDNME